MAIPILNLQAEYQRMREQIDRAVLQVLESGQFVLGPNVQALEAELAAFLSVARAVAVASGTDALHLGLRACGIGPGDVVLDIPLYIRGDGHGHLVHRGPASVCRHPAGHVPAWTRSGCARPWPGAARGPAPRGA